MKKKIELKRGVRLRSGVKLKDEAEMTKEEEQRKKPFPKYEGTKKALAKAPRYTV